MIDSREQVTLRGVANYFGEVFDGEVDDALRIAFEGLAQHWRILVFAGSRDKAVALQAPSRSRARRHRTEELARHRQAVQGQPQRAADLYV